MIDIEQTCEAAGRERGETTASTYNRRQLATLARTTAAGHGGTLTDWRIRIQASGAVTLVVVCESVSHHIAL